MKALAIIGAVIAYMVAAVLCGQGLRERSAPRIVAAVVAAAGSVTFICVLVFR